MLSTFKWDALQSFLAVVRTGRLTTAAQQMGVDHSTLSRRIADLERTLQTKLFNRSVSGYALTIFRMA
jgi:DNA-binding transcriptional LysR family regulator